MKLSDFTTLSFDCYGTLIDWESGLAAALNPLAERSGRSPSELLEAYGPIEHALEEEHPGLRYSDLLEKVHSRLCERLGVATDAAEARAFGQSVADWPAFADSPQALRYLKQHFRLIILSNVDRASFARSNARLGVEFDQVLTAEEIGSYKPALRNFEYLLERLAGDGTGKSDLLHVAQSLFHDHAPANRLGIASAWIDRRAGQEGAGATPPPDPPPHYDFRFASLGEFADAHRAEIG
jgi:2-haloalkanoic acid dehalogenase type II